MPDTRAEMNRRLTLKGAVIQQIVAANPHGRLKAVEYDSFGGIKRIEWHDDREKTAGDDGLTPIPTDREGL